jgi:hypothetical protein
MADENSHPDTRHDAAPGSGPDEPGSQIPSWILSSGHRVNPNRIDLALAAAIEQQAQLVLAGSFLAAAYPDLTLTSSESCGSHEGSVAAPRYLNCELGLLTRLIRLSLAAGVTLPTGMPTTYPHSMSSPAGFAAARQSSHRHAVAVLERISVSEDVRTSTRESARDLMRELEDLTRRSETSALDTDGSRPPPRRSTAFLPGELLG